MKDIIIIGAGDIGREVAALLKRINAVKPTWNLVGFADDDIENKPKGSRNEYGKVLGTVAEINAVTEPVNVVIAFGSAKTVQAVRSRLTNTLIHFPNIIAPEAMISDSENYKMGQGNVLFAFSSLGCNARIGDFNILINYSSIGHDVNAGDYNVLMTSAHIGGGCRIGSVNTFGMGSVVKSGISVNNYTTLEDGSILLEASQDGGTYMGNPAERLRK